MRPFNWALYVFYGGDIRETELPWLCEQVKSIAALPPVDDDGDMPIGLFVVSDERATVSVWEVREGMVHDRPAPSWPGYSANERCRMTEDEAETVAALAAQCAWGARSSWDLMMRYGRLFTPGTDAGGGYPMIPAWAGKNAYQRAMDSGLLYAEGYTCRPRGIHVRSAWCLDGEVVVDPGFSESGTAYFGVPLRSGYVRRWRAPMKHGAPTTATTCSCTCSSAGSKSSARH